LAAVGRKNSTGRTDSGRTAICLHFEVKEREKDIDRQGHKEKERQKNIKTVQYLFFSTATYRKKRSSKVAQ